MAKKVLWFSRHQLSSAQLEDLQALYGPVEIHQVDRSIEAVSDIKAEIISADIIAVVAPIHLQGQFLQIAKDRPVLICRNHRVPTEEKTPQGEPVYQFVHAGWDQLQRIEVVKTTLSNHTAPEGTFRQK